MASLHKYWGVKYRIRRQREFLDNPEAVAAARKMLDQREEFERSFSPENGRLAICSTCPVTDCGLADKHGIQNVYEGSIIKFYCPHHGEYKVDISDDHEITRLQFSTPLRHLLRAMIFASDEKSDWVRITGADYAGYYQEQLLWRHISQADSPIIIYAPLIHDWSGVKVSKSLYIREGTYDYLKTQGLEYCLSFAKFQAERKDLDVIFKEVESWEDDPSRLCRSYSLEYIHSLFEKAGRVNGVNGKVAH